MCHSNYSKNYTFYALFFLPQKYSKNVFQFMYIRLDLNDNFLKYYLTVIVGKKINKMKRIVIIMYVTFPFFIIIKTLTLRDNSLLRNV